jgi:hypothetical protein
MLTVRVLGVIVDYDLYEISLEESSLFGFKNEFHSKKYQDSIEQNQEEKVKKSTIL